MTLEELRDLIDSTINENGNKAITGKALNLCMNELVQYVANNKPQTTERLYMDLTGAAPITEEQQASNAALYEKLKTAFENDELLPIVVYQGAYPESSAVISSMNGFLNPVMVGTSGEYEGKIMLYLMMSQAVILSADGSVTLKS